MNTLIDIVGSAVIGIYFVYMIMNFNMKMNDAINTSAQNNVALWESIEIGDLFDHDFNKIGYRADSVFAFAKAEKSEIEFYGDLDNDGIVDTVQYVLLDSAYLATHDYYFSNNINPASGTQYPNDSPLFRIVNGTLYSNDNAVYIVTNFEIIYNDLDGNKITTLLDTHAQRKNIKGVTLNYRITSPSPVESNDDTVYEVIECQKKFVPRNIY